jgi:hypothetical protein
LLIPRAGHPSIPVSPRVRTTSRDGHRSNGHAQTPRRPLFAASVTQQHARAPMVPRTLALPTSASSCPRGLSWGVLYGGYCRACYDFRRRHPSACCAGCRHDVPLKKNYCRLCWLQAALQAANPPVVTEADLVGVTHHQLAFAGTTKDARSSLRRTPTRRATALHSEPRAHWCLPRRRWWAVAAVSPRTRASLRLGCAR